MKILFIIEYTSLPGDNGNSRFIYLLNKIKNHENQVELISTSFSHSKKMRREIPIDKQNIYYKITLLDEPGYKKNVSLKRLHSHKVLSKNLKKYLSKLDYKPDVIYCSIPSLDVAKVAVKFANKNKIRFILDIQDLWPESFKMTFNVPILSDILFFPMMKKANYIYSHSDEIVAVSETYVERGMSVNKKIKKGLSVFLGTDLDYFDKCAKENKVEINDDLIRIAYIGTLGTSYDIKTIIDAIEVLNNKGLKNIIFVIMGDGPLKNEFKEYATSKNINCEFTGKLNYPKMVGLLKSCDIAVNPINGTSAASIINKVGDYAASGLPVINTQKSKEYCDLVKKYSAGFNCQNFNDVVNSLEKLINDKNLRKKLGDGNRNLAEEKFDRKKTYKEIIKLIGG